MSAVTIDFLYMRKSHALLVQACDSILLATGGSSKWTGETRNALIKIEVAVAMAVGKDHLEAILDRANSDEHLRNVG